MTSIRDKDVFVVQSGSEKINDSIMELLIMISACKGGSANKITGKIYPLILEKQKLTFLSGSSILSLQQTVEEEVS